MLPSIKGMIYGVDGEQKEWLSLYLASKCIPNCKPPTVNDLCPS